MRHRGTFFLKIRNTHVFLFYRRLIIMKFMNIIIAACCMLVLAAAFSGCTGEKVHPKIGDTVKVDYTLYLSDGTIFDTSEGGEPLEFTLGMQEVITGFEEAVRGMTPGEEITVTIPASEAYGEYDPALVLPMTIDEYKEFVPSGAPEVGQQFQVMTSDGQVLILIIVDVEEDSITVDANSVLAGEDLTFDIKLIEIL